MGKRGKIHLGRPMSGAMFKFAWCGNEGGQPAANVVEPMSWNFLPPTAFCRKCERSIGKPSFWRHEYSVAVEAALICIARVWSPA